MKKDEFGKNISKIEATIGYTFRDKSLLRQAFTRTSWCNERGSRADVRYQSNEVLEFFGDSVLSAVIISFLLESRTQRCEYGIRTELSEGDFSSIKSKLSDKTNLSLSTKRLGLEKFLLLGEGDAKLGIANEPSVMEDLFESIVGAVYIDSGKSMEIVTRVVSGILDMSVYEKDSVTVQSAKNALQEWCADKSRRLPPPVYKTLDECGPDHKKTYERGVYIGERLVGRARGKNQKAADALAAHAALELLLAEEREKSVPKTPTRVKKTADKPKEKSFANVNKGLDAKKTGTANPTAAKPKKSGMSKPVSRILEPTPKATSVIKDMEDLAFLKKYARERGCPTPTFHDLGVTRLHNGAIEYRIECELAGMRATGAAATRTVARGNAISAMREQISKKDERAKSPKQHRRIGGRKK